MSITTIPDAVGGSGVVTVPGDGGAVREFIVSPLSLDGEDVFFSHLVRLAEARQRESRAEFLADMAAKSIPTWERQQAIKALVESRDNAPSEDTIYRQRLTVEGTAVELWHRSKANHPGLKIDEVKAIVTEATHFTVRRQLRDIMQGIGKAGKPPETAFDDTKSPSGTTGPV